MASPSSVITMGFGVPGSASLVITDGYGIGVADQPSGGRRRRRRRFWESVLAEADIPTPTQVRQERQMVEEMLVAAELDQLISEQKVLRGALEVAQRRQAKQINAMIESIDRRISEMHDEDDVILTLLGD